MKLLILASLAICCLTAYVVEGIGTEVPERYSCVSLQTKPISVNKIKSYSIKEGPARAVIFVTRRGFKICADPEASWVKAAVKNVSNKFTTRRNMLQTSPTGAQQSTNTTVTMTG
ncbi:PREDICTED: lymphotactin [Elephantulus edwardii]|uniref:lymphotactin n=1 Tax=Elephantulus edwardii TaxID=28737 RepID=UPI0003F0A7AE|nr:PREDICTED: lymphotactin [Elephantulus edwardii]